MKNAVKGIGRLFLIFAVVSGFAWADSNLDPEGITADRILARFAEAMRARNENVLLVRRLFAEEKRELKLYHLYGDEDFSKLVDEGCTVQIFHVADQIKGKAKYVAYLAKIQMAMPNEWNRGFNHFVAEGGTEWLVIAGPSPLVDKEIAGVKVIGLPDEALGIVSAAADNKLGVDAKDFLSDLKVLSGGKELSEEKLSRLKTNAGQEVYKQMQAASR